MPPRLFLLTAFLLTASLLLTSCGKKGPQVPEVQAHIERIIEYDSLIGVIKDLGYHEGFLYATDYKLYKILKMDTTGHVVATTGRRGDARGEFAKTLSTISVNRDSVFVTDGGRILSYDTTLQLHHIYHEPKQWYNIWDVAFDQQGRLAVAGGATDVDEEFAPNFLEHPTQWSAPTYHLNFWSFDEYFITPAGDQGTYFTYRSAPYVEVYDARGKLIREWKLPHDCDDNPSYDADRTALAQLNLTNQGEDIAKRMYTSCVGSLTTTRSHDLLLLSGDFSPTPKGDVLHYNVEGVLLRRIVLPQKYLRIAYASDSTLFAVPHKPSSIVHRLRIPPLK